MTSEHYKKGKITKQEWTTYTIISGCFNCHGSLKGTQNVANIGTILDFMLADKSSVVS